MSKVLLQRSWPDGKDSGATDALPDRSRDDNRDVASREPVSVGQPDVDGEQNLLTPTFTTPIESRVSKDKNAKHRFGLPAGFVSRRSRFGRTILLQDNVYRLPNGIEFIPLPPAGTLGSRNHQYALLTLAQYEKRLRGSIYVRTDGRIFDYAFDHNDPERELFDTGFTIIDLERTGRYAPALQTRKSPSRKRRKIRKKGAKRKRVGK